MNKEKQIKDITQYYVLRNKDTGMYFRGKGVNRWGKYFNQATIYRVKGTAEASVREVSWHGEKAEVVPIQIFENEAGYLKASEVAREVIDDCIDILNTEYRKCDTNDVKIILAMVNAIAELKKKYESEKDDGR